ncbi:MAG: Flp pilus assembly complex ATPase component TadA [Gemmatimonadota bacterium]|nr:Flp pilus assembly complex ATPase component TadA [Gemmatimonadota bacterium]
MLGDGFVELFEDPSVLELYVNPGGALWVDRIGAGRSPTPHRISHNRVEQFLNVMASHLGETLTPSRPTIQGELPATRFRRARLQGYLPPRAPAAGFNVRKHATEIFSLDSYLRRGAISLAHVERLVAAVDGHLNILIAGGTKSGKTTFVNALLREISERHPEERVVIIEDTAELQCAAADVVFLRTLPGESMAPLVRETLRLSPDRVFCGEFRDAAAYHCCDLWSTGHPGGAATTHADDAEGALHRTNRLALDGKGGSQMELVARAVNLVVVMRRSPRGGRVAELALVDGLDSRGRFRIERLAPGAAEPKEDR